MAVTSSLPSLLNGPMELDAADIRDGHCFAHGGRWTDCDGFRTRPGAGADGRALYTGDPVRTGVCTPVAAGAVHTPVGTGLLVRKVPVAGSGHLALPLAVP